MKSRRILAIFSAVLLLAAIPCLCSCGAADDPSFFMFASVRIKGNNDGTITAVAQNEFSIGNASVPATLIIYESDGYTADVSVMRRVCDEHGDSLRFLQKLCATVAVDGGYYCAVLEYTVNGEIKYIQSDTVHYDDNGKRI